MVASVIDRAGTRLDRLLSPRVVALVGDSRACRRVLAANDGLAGPDMRFWVVHPRGMTAFETDAGSGADGTGREPADPVLRAGRIQARVVTRVAELPEPPDAAFVAVPAAHAAQVVGALAGLGCGGAVVYSSGFAETTTGAGLQAELIEAAAGMPLLGPNCYGLLNYLDGVALWPDQHGGRRLAAHDDGQVARGVAIVAQSSSIAISMTMADNGLPLAYCATVGNAAALTAFEFASVLLGRPGVSAIGLLLESVAPVAELEALAAAARRAEVPVVALVLGRSVQAQRVGRSHSASLHTPAALASVLLHRLGIGEVTGVEELLATLSLLHCHGPLPGRRLTSLSCSGGEASLIADAVALGTRRDQPGLEFPPLTQTQRAGLERALGERVTLDNPLDYHTYVWADRAAMTRAFTAMLADPGDLNLFFADQPRADRCDPADWLPGLEAFIEACRLTGARGAVTAAMSVNLPGNLATELVRQSLPVLAPPSAAVAAMAAAAGIGAAWAGPPPEALRNPPRWDATGTGWQWPEDEAKDLLSRHGVPVPAGLRCADPEQAIATATDWFADSATVVLKALGPAGVAGPAHKTEAGAVRLCRSPEQAGQVARAYLERFGGVLVERHVPGSLVELLVSLDVDPVVGMVLTLGAGGQLVELLDDTVRLLLPCTEREIRQGLHGLTVAGLLTGHRGRPPAAADAAVRAILGIAELAARLPGLTGLEVNPLIVTAGEAVAVDVLLVTSRPRARPPGGLT